MIYIFNFIVKRQNLQSKLSYTTMVWILISVLTVISITITLTLDLLGESFKKEECVIIFTVVFIIVSVFLGTMLTALQKMRETFPLNIMVLTAYAICISVAEGYPVINVSVLIKVGAWFGALILCSILATIGIFIKSDLRNHSIAFLIYCAVVLICNIDSVYRCLFWRLSTLALGIFVAGVLAVMIPVAVCFGQLTFSQFIHGYNPDYCLAVLVLLTTVLGFFVIFSVEVNLLMKLTGSKTMNVSLYVL
uniref:SJCHGC09323 protein n=1 Tax=Schistosoma japonicum TaxID=6182 RepID=Q5DF11_SCHJA|nr:SJCHGC09323 protein [Schistosoma japonicum]